MRRALAGSAALHATVAALILLGPRGLPTPAELAPVEVELVQQIEAVPGGAPGAAAAPAPDRPAPPERDGEQPAPPPAEPAPTAAPHVNLGDSERTREAMLVTGENVVPPAPDAVYRNRPPAYPRDAARIGAEGTVGLVIQIGPDGVPEQVVVVASSGNASLDRAARDAVARWHFHPARAGGVAVPYVYRMNVHFSLGDR